MAQPFFLTLETRKVNNAQGTNYRYQSWQPIQTNITTQGTKPPYYGHIVVAAMIGDQSKSKTAITNIPTSDEREAVYAAYTDQALAKIAIINMRQYNYTVNGTTDIPNPVPRPVVEYDIQVPGIVGEVGVERLLANGSDAISGITWDGISYNWELNEGRPVRLGNVTVGERVRVENGTVKVGVADSEAVILRFGNVY